MVLWVVGILSLFVASFAFDAHIEARIISFYRKRAKAETLAEAGLSVVEWLLRRAQAAAAAAPSGSQVSTDPVSQAIEMLRGGAEIDGIVLRIVLDGRGRDAATAKLMFQTPHGVPAPEGDSPAGSEYGRIRLRITPKPALRNINNLNLNNNSTQDPKSEQELEQNLERLLTLAGVDPLMWEDYIDPFIDWIDPDDISRDPNNPAETDDWYANFGYAAANGPIATIDELRLIKNFNEAITNETDEGEIITKPPVAEQLRAFVTTYGDGKVNVNAAGTNVLMTIPYMTEANAAAIYELARRPDQATGMPFSPFKDWADLNNRVPDLDPRVQPYLAYVSSEFEVASTGECHGVAKTITCVVEFDRGQNRLKIKEWREDL